MHILFKLLINHVNACPQVVFNILCRKGNKMSEEITLKNNETNLPSDKLVIARKLRSAAFVLYKTINASILDQTPLREMSRFHGLDIVTMEGFMRQRQYNWFKSLFDNHEIKHVGETGFNGGHSAFAFANLGAETVTSFDLCEHRYVKPAARFLEQRFPSTNFELVIGDSSKTLPQYIGSVAFDLMFIDGGHSQEVAAEDIASMHRLSTKNGLVVVDDYNNDRTWRNGPKAAYDNAVNDGLIEPIQVRSGDLRTWALGKFVK